MDIYVDSAAFFLPKPFSLTPRMRMIVSESCYTSHSKIIAMEKIQNENSSFVKSRIFNEFYDKRQMRFLEKGNL